MACPSPIEVWLRQRNLTVRCKVVYADESTEEWEIDSLSMRSACARSPAG